MTLAHDELHPEHNANLHSKQENEHDEVQIGAEGESQSETHDDLDLENAIGDAFKQFAMMGAETGHHSNEQLADLKTDTSPHFGAVENSSYSGTEHVYESVDQVHESVEEAHDNVDMDIEKAVGDFFRSGEHHLTESSTQTYENRDQDEVDENVSHNSDTIHENYEDRIPSDVADAHSQKPLSISKPDISEEVKDVEIAGYGNSIEIPHWPTESENSSEIRHSDNSTTASTKSSQIVKNEDSSSSEISSVQDISLPKSSAKDQTPYQTSISYQDSNENVAGHISPKTDENNQSQESNKDADQDLENAIGDAFKSLVGGMDQPEYSSNEAVPDVSDFQTDDADFDDIKLEDAIGEAFKSLAKTLNHPEHSKTTTDLHPPRSETAEFQNAGIIADVSDAADTEFQLDDIVQNVVQQMKDSKDDVSLGDTSTLSSEGTSRKSTSASSVPENEAIAHTDEMPLDLDAALKAAVESAVKSAFPAGRLQPASTSESSESTSEKVSDLEQKQMNEILQNAFQMAMHAQPEAAGSDEPVEPGLRNLPTSSKSSDKSSLAGTSATTKKAEKKQTPETASHTQSNAKTTETKRPLSIAETLALHRANMSASTQRDYSSINSLEDSVRSGNQATFLPPSQVHPQLSTILSSLSQHIQSGTHSSNLMSVIRSMTNALMHNKRVLTSFSKAGQDSIKSIKNSPEDKEFYVKCLQTAVQLLQSKKDDDYRAKATGLIESISGAIENRKKSNASDFTRTEDSPQKSLAENLTPFYDTAFSSFTDLDLSRLRLVIAGVKPDVDSEEYLDRVREGNRERKKKWREENAERNKDNDLRFRVLKRAATKFGEASSEEKSNWVEKEYLKRKHRRFVRQQKDQAKVEGPNSSDESAGQDPLLVKRITETFNMVSECGFDEDPRATLMALSAAIASVASTCAQISRLTDSSVVIDAISSIVNSIYESNLRACIARKFQFLIRRADQPPPSTSKSDKIREEVLRNFPDLKNLSYTRSEASKESDDVSADSSSQPKKREGTHLVESPPKKPKTEEVPITADRSMSDSGGDLEDSDMPSANESWTSPANLKMPQYRKPSVTSIAKDAETTYVKGAEPEPIEVAAKITSPFISNKIGINAVNYPGTGTLRKPGSLQRPGFTKSASRSNKLGFPTLYSPSFKSK